MEGERAISLHSVERPRKRGAEDELEWLCKCFGFDAQDPRSDILRVLLKAERKDEGVRSVVISQKMQLTRGGAVYHLNRLIETGLVVRRGRQYELRAPNLEETLEEMEEDIVRMFRRMREIAKDVDTQMGLQEQPE